MIQFLSRAIKKLNVWLVHTFDFQKLNENKGDMFSCYDPDNFQLCFSVSYLLQSCFLTLPEGCSCPHVSVSRCCAAVVNGWSDAILMAHILICLSIMTNFHNKIIFTAWICVLYWLLQFLTSADFVPPFKESLSCFKNNICMNMPEVLQGRKRHHSLPFS